MDPRSIDLVLPVQCSGGIKGLGALDFAGAVDKEASCRNSCAAPLARSKSDKRFCAHPLISPWDVSRTASLTSRDLSNRRAAPSASHRSCGLDVSAHGLLLVWARRGHRPAAIWESPMNSTPDHALRSKAGHGTSKTNLDASQWLTKQANLS